MTDIPRSLVHVAIIQAGGYLFDTAKTMNVLLAKTTEAANNGARLVVFPEAFLGGYPKGNHFGAPVGSRSDQGRELFKRYYQSAISVPGKETQQIAEWCRDLNVDLVVGVVERSTDTHDRGTLYCSALTFAADGRFIGKRRKLIPTAAERIIWGRGDGSTLQVHEGATGRIATVICWENFMPALRISQYAQGVDFYCAPTVDDRENWTSLMRTIAMEGRCFVLSANQFMTRRQVPAEFSTIQGDTDDTVLVNGGSVVVSPLGDIIAGPHFGSETILYAELDLQSIDRAKMDFEATGHYSRSDIFSLQVNQNAQAPVNFKS